MAVAALFQAAELAAWETRLKQANDRLGRSGDLPDDIAPIVARLRDEILAVSQADLEEIDPYLVVTLQRGVMVAAKALSDVWSPATRREMRVALEQMRQSLRDLADEAPVSDARPVKEILVWLRSVLAVSQETMAELVGADPRTLQRWLAPGTSGPGEDRALRIRVLARLVKHLRHVLTGPGVARWLEKPRPELGGRRPLDLLDDVDALPRLGPLASQIRSTSAA